ncbi:MAG: hypothetical protein IJD23_03580 [Spirochaetaceae bacterium]|nr:hypothetical protein [Spirochaetaceae bacterium]MBQ3024373.1 hypothetical protein [Spirochaetaceae bacterium]
MTLQKAMRIRAELKKEISNLNELIHDYPHQISFENRIPEPEELRAKREEKSLSLDGMNYEDVIKRMFTITDIILELNIAIEKANREGHNLLFKEASIKSKISLLDYQINSERIIKPEVERLDYDYDHMDEKGNFKRVKVTTYNYAMLTDETFGMSLIEYKKKLNKELEEVRDELSAFNASRKIDYELPEGIL